MTVDFAAVDWGTVRAHGEDSLVEPARNGLLFIECYAQQRHRDRKGSAAFLLGVGNKTT
jgi:hypothetical protein